MKKYYCGASLRKIHQLALDRMKKILAIDQGEHLGGAEIFFAEILRELAAGRMCGKSWRGENKTEVHLLTAGTDQYLAMYRGSGVIIHKVDLPRLKPVSLQALVNFGKAAAALAKKMRDIVPDLVISNTVRAHILSSAAAHRGQIPLLWMAHDITFPKALLRRFIRFPKKIICCSGFVRDYYAAALPRRPSSKLPPSFELLYPFAISAEQVAALAAPDKFAPDKPCIIGMVGNFIPWKGHDLFIKMARAIHTRYPTARFEIIGRTYEGNQESAKFRKKCEAEAAPLIAAKVLRIRESVPSAIEEMAKWKILIHCSKAPEPLGRVILEGMAAGCAVIASNLGGPREIIHSAGLTPVAHPIPTNVKEHSAVPDGILIVPDSKNLIEAVSFLLADHLRMKTLSNAALAKIKRDFSREQVFLKLSDIIASSL